MPLNMQDPYLRAERQPPALIALGVRLKNAYHVGVDNFGIRGNEFHYTGFHRSRAFLESSTQGNGGDYSTRGARNQGGNENNNCAFDFTPGVWGTADNREKMKTLTRRLHDAAVRRDPALHDWYEFAGTLDGVNVVTFYADGGAFKTPFDKTHLDHIHGSKYRDASDNDNTALADIMLGLNEEDDMGASFGPTLMRSDDDEFPMTIPPAEGGTADPRQTWLNAGIDFNGPVTLRIFQSKGDGNFLPLTVLNPQGTWVAEFPDGKYQLVAGRVLSRRLEPGVRFLSVLRVAGTGQDKPSRAAVSFCYERK